MKIIHVVCTAAFAGVERHVAVLAAAQHDMGDEVIVLGGDTEKMRTAIGRRGVSVLAVTDVTDAARKLARTGHVDMIATHMTAADLVAATTPAHWRTPIVSTRHFAASRGSTPPVRAAAALASTRITAQIAVSQYIAESIGDSATVVLPGLANRPDAAPARSRDRSVLLVQRLEVEKSSDVGLRAFAASGLADRGWRLRVAGSGAQRAQLEGLATSLGIVESTDFLGHRNDVGDLMAHAGLLLAPSAIEGFGLSVLEAMASGLPVVASAAGGHLESIGPVPDAALFPIDDSDAAASHLAALAANPDRRDRYGAALQERQRASFSVAAQVTSTTAVYEYAIAATRRRPAPVQRPTSDLVVISLEAWDEVWRRNQHVIAGLLQQDPDVRVLFVEPATDLTHALRRGHPPRRGAGLRRGPHLSGVAADALWLLEPTKVLPRRLDPAQDERWADAVHRTARQLGFTQPTLWVNDPHGALVMQRAGWPTLYDITDDWLAANRDGPTLARLTLHEGALMEGAGEVVVCSRGLVATKSAQRRVTLIPNAVDVEATRRPTNRPADLTPGHTVIYVGTLHSDRLDVDLCVETARALEGAGTLSLVGPDALDHDERRRLDEAGVARHGPKDRRAVSAYLQHADVLVVPHLVDAFTDSLDPIKLYEYQAVGRPVVTTPVGGFREAAASDRLHVVDSTGFPAAVRALLPPADSYPTGADTSVPSWADRVHEFRAVLDRVSRRPAGASPELPLADVPADVRVRLGHAAAQHVADERGLDVLHIKGDALDDSLIYVGRLASDADILVRPGQVDQFITACLDIGYRRSSRFATGSPFEHSTTLWHDQWGHLDVHRHYPGIGSAPRDAFDLLWASRGHKDIAGIACPTPALAAQVVILVLHAGRSLPGGQPHADVRHAWERGNPSVRESAQRWVEGLRAEVAFAAGTGELESVPDSPQRDLWLAVTHEGRVREWRARVMAAPDLRTRLVLMMRALLVNTDHLAAQLGRPPTSAEVARSFVRRIRDGLTEIIDRRDRS